MKSIKSISGRGIFVITVDVFTVMAGAPTARVAAEP